MPGSRAGIEAAWYARAWWLWLLRPLEWLFRALAALRRYCYSSGLLSSFRADKPVVVVGNITVGGTGKTPVVIALVEALQARGIRPGVVSRGYGASPGLFPHTVSDGSTTAQCGDEPLLIYRRTGCPCVVGPARAAAVRALLQQFHVDIVISDDGLQHYALCRDMEIAVLDAARGCGNGFCLPAGPLREPPRRLQSVDFVLYRGGLGPADGVRYEPQCLENVATGEQRPVLPASPGERVYAVAGIGQPAQFFQSLRDLGFHTAEHAYPDHHTYTAADLANLADRPVIMTEKDAVKCRDFAADNAWYVKINAQLPAALIQAVTTLAHN